MKYFFVLKMHLQQDSRTPVSVQPIDWLVGKLDFGDTLRSWIPGEFEGYVRILHPAYLSIREDGIEVATKEVSWSQLSEWSGKQLSGSSHILDLSFDVSGNNWDQNGQRGRAPLQGQLDPTLQSALLGYLAKATTSPADIWMLIWTGFGGPIDTIGLPVEVSEQLVSSGRKYFLRSGAIISSSAARADSLREHAPSFWWPNDRAWFVSSDIDSSSTYVGGSKTLIQQILNDHTFEAFHALLDDPFDGLLITPPPIVHVRMGFRERLRIYLNHYIFRFGNKPISGTAIVFRRKRWWEW